MKTMIAVIAVTAGIVSAGMATPVARSAKASPDIEKRANAATPAAADVEAADTSPHDTQQPAAPRSPGARTGDAAAADAKKRDANGKKAAIDPRRITLKPYVDPKRKRVYWPLEKPVWVRIAEGPEKEARSYLVSEMAETSALSPEQYLDKGIRLDVTGRQHLRWYNSKTGKTVMLRFRADGNPPTFAAKIRGAQSADVDGRRYYGADVSVEIEARDKESGLDKIYASVDGKGYAPVSGPITVKEPKAHTIAFFAADNVGNAGEPKNIAFTIDAADPVTKHDFATAPAKGIVAPGNQITLQSSDQGAGVATVYYALGEKEQFKKYRDKPLSLDKLKDGQYTLRYFAEDLVGNREKVKTADFYCDAHAPVPALIFEGPSHTADGKEYYLAEKSRMKAVAKDTKSGVATVEYALDGTRFARFTEPVALSPGAGVQTVKVRATDVMGNASDVHTFRVRIDTTAPSTKHSLDGPSFVRNGAVWITPDTRLLLTARDAEAGVKATEYKIDDGDAVRYKDGIVLSAPGEHVISYRSVDEVNNREEPLSATVIVDGDAPEIVETFSVVAADSLAAGKKKLPAYPRGTAVYLAARDNASGTREIRYAINEKKEQPYAGELRFDATGKYTIKLRAIDNVGLTKTKEVSFTIKD